MSILPFQPVGPVVIVAPKPTDPRSTESGIQLADVYEDEPTSGMIVAIGTGFRCAACECAKDAEFQIGDCVVFARSAGAVLPFAVEGQDCLVLREDEILAVVNPNVVCEVV